MKKYQSFLSENVQFLQVKFSIYLNRRVFVNGIFEVNISGVTRMDVQSTLVITISLISNNRSSPREKSGPFFNIEF